MFVSSIKSRIFFFKLKRHLVNSMSFVIMYLTMAIMSPLATSKQLGGETFFGGLLKVKSLHVLKWFPMSVKVSVESVILCSEGLLKLLPTGTKFFSSAMWEMAKLWDYPGEISLLSLASDTFSHHYRDLVTRIKQDFNRQLKNHSSFLNLYRKTYQKYKEPCLLQSSYNYFTKKV